MVSGAGACASRSAADAAVVATANQERETNLSVRIRLRRMGAKGRPFYRLVVANSRSPRDGRFIETIGHFDPLTEPPTVKINEERAQLWLSRGAQPSDTARALLKENGLIGGDATVTETAEQ